MKGGFFDWIRNKAWHFAGRDEPFTLDVNTTDKQIRKAIELLLDEQRASEARPALHAIKKRAAPFLEKAVLEPRFRNSTQWPWHCAATALEMMLEVLDACGSPTPMREAAAMVTAGEAKQRKIAALFLSRTGSAKYGAEIERLLKDDEYIVSSTATEELLKAAKEGHVEPALAAMLYGFLLESALRTDRGWGNEAAELMLLFDRDRAAPDLTSPAALAMENNWLSSNLDALREGKVLVAPDKLRHLLHQSLLRYDEEPDRTWSFHWAGIAASCLRSLVTSGDSEIAVDLERLLDHEYASLRNTAAEVQLQSLGFDPSERVFEAVRAKGFEALSPAQQAYFAVFMLDAEVRNGGFLQYFSNSSGEHVRIAHAGLAEMGALASAQVVSEAMARFGQAGPPVDRDQRNDLLAKLIPQDESPFDGLDGRWYADEDHLRVRMQRFAIANRAQIEA